MPSADSSPARADGRVRPYAPLAISLALHLVVLLIMAPWLVLRSVHVPPAEVEVMLEPATPQPPAARPEPATRLAARAPAPTPKAAIRPPQPAQPQPVQAQPDPAPAQQAGQGEAGRAALAAREAAGLSAPRAPSAPTPVAPRAAGGGELARETPPARVAVRAPSVGSAPQPAARRATVPSRPGETASDGQLTLAGTAAQAQSVAPEFRQAARQGGQTGIRGGSQAPDDGLASQVGRSEQQALVAARDVPHPVPASQAARGGQPPAWTAPPAVRTTGQGRVAATEHATPDAARLASAGMGIAPAGIAPTPVAAGSGRGSGNIEAPRSAAPAERGGGLMQAAAPVEPGSGAASHGSGPGGGASGEGRAQQLAGVGSRVREGTTAALLAAASPQRAARPESDGGGAYRLSERSENAASVQPVREAGATALQTEEARGEAHVIEERFHARALKVNSPRSVCELPLLFAGFDRKPIPKGLDSINATAATLPDEIPPRHHPGNQLPRYPLQALGSRAEGRVVVRAEVQTDGLVGQSWVKQTSGAQMLDLAALETVRGWRFLPGQRHGMAVSMWLDVPIEYKLP